MYCQDCEEISNSLELTCDKMSTELVTIHIQEYSYSCQWCFLSITHSHTHSILFNMNCCRIAQTHAKFLTCVFLEGKKSYMTDKLLLNTTQTAFGIMYTGTSVTCIYISLSTTQACSHTHADTHTHVKVAAMLLHNLCKS
jgi:hypothetical protein